MEALSAKERIIVPIDTDDLNRAVELVADLRDHVGAFKFGLEFGTSLLVSLVRGTDCDGARAQLDLACELFRLLDGRVMWDGKFDDIPNTMGGAARGTNALRPKFLTVHASSGIDGMFAAVDNRGEASVLAVTVLTSRGEDDAHLTFGGPTKAKVLQFAREAVLAGAQGIVCSPQELGLIKSRRELKGLVTVVPGVRPTWAAANDQKRVMTPGEAVRAGADYLVIGRPIIQPPEKFLYPHEAADMIAGEIANALGQTAL
ncbi:MAG: orotidine-5'-phosphate decarboxylase [Candidatus Uhrbacteria bacterium]